MRYGYETIVYQSVIKLTHFHDMEQERCVSCTQKLNIGYKNERWWKNDDLDPLCILCDTVRT